MKKTLYIFALVLWGLVACDDGDPFNGQGMRPSVPGVSDAQIVEVEKAQYEPTYKELYLHWKPVAEELKASFLGTEVTFTTYSGKPLTTNIMRDKNFPQGYERIAVATNDPSSVIYRSIWRNEDGEQIFSDYCKLKDLGLEIKNVNVGPEETFKTMHMPEWKETNDFTGTPESDLYYNVVGTPPYGYYENSLKTVCGAMWFNENDPYRELVEMDCWFKKTNDAGIVAYVTGSGNTTIICIGQEAVHKLLTSPIGDARQEISGVCYHELTHTMQVNDLNAGDDFNKYCFVEGGADASRLICGGFTESERLTRAKKAVALAEDQTADPKKAPHPWLEQYDPSGFFIAWLRRYDGDFWRKFNYSSQLIASGWTFEAAVKLIFADNTTVAADIEAENCKSDILRGLWRVYKKDVESEQISE